MRIDVLIDYLIDYLRECDSLDSEKVHNLILDLEALTYARRYSLCCLLGIVETEDDDANGIERQSEIPLTDKQIKEKVKYKDALGEIKSSPIRDFAENWNAEQWAKFYEQDIVKLQRIASKALYEVKI